MGAEGIGLWCPESLPSLPFIHHDDCLWALPYFFSYSHLNSERFLQEISLYLQSFNNSFFLGTNIETKNWNWEDWDKASTAFNLIMMLTARQLTAIPISIPDLGVILWFCWGDLLLGRDPLFLFNSVGFHVWSVPNCSLLSRNFLISDLLTVAFLWHHTFIICIFLLSL